jgi:hypothetical protein
MRYVVSGPRPHSTIIDELDINASNEARAARMFYHDTGTIPDLVEPIEDSEVTVTLPVVGWCVLCDGPIFEHQDWIHPEPDTVAHADGDCEDE